MSRYGIKIRSYIRPYVLSIIIFAYYVAGRQDIIKFLFKATEPVLELFLNQFPLHRLIKHPHEPLLLTGRVRAQIVCPAFFPHYMMTQGKRNPISKDCGIRSPPLRGWSPNALSCVVNRMGKILSNTCSILAHTPTVKAQSRTMWKISWGILWHRGYGSKLLCHTL